VSRAPLDLLQGTLDVLILRTLTWAPMHGYGISRWIRDRTDGVLAVENAALYQALHRLERKKWVRAEWGVSDNNRRAKYYELTPLGRAQLRVETDVWHTYAEAVHKVLAPSEV
jgi:PadR family transcriptional regulator, regulatory protein PadR